MRKIISIFLIMAYLNIYFACTTTRSSVIMLPEANITNNEIPIYLVTIDSVVYSFERQTYMVKNEYLLGIGSKNYTEVKKWIKIPLKDIKNVRENNAEYDTNIIIKPIEELSTTSNDLALELVTVDAVHYYFEEKNYMINNGLLIGKGWESDDVTFGKAFLKTGKEVDIEIPIMDIKRLDVKTTEFDWIKTSILGLVIVVPIIYLGIALANFEMEGMSLGN